MTVKNQVIELLSSGGEFSVNQVAEQIGRKRTAVCNAITRLRDKGDLTVTRKVGNTLYFREKRKGSLACERTKPDVFEQCRQNWSGYKIHKIFGSASRATA